MRYEFEQKEWEKLPLLSLRFKVNYWILKKIGLEGFRVLCVLGGALFTVIIYEVVIPYFN